MGKKNDKKVEDIEFEILAAESHLADLKKKKAKLNKNNFRTTHFSELPSSIENIAAHIAIRNNESVVVLFCYDTDEFRIYYKNHLLREEDIFNDSGNHVTTSFDVEHICEFALDFDEELAIDYFNYFGCVITPDGDEYTIEPLKINTDFQIVFEED